MRLGANNEIIDPQVHDAEIKSIEFATDAIVVSISLPHEQREFSLRCAGPIWFDFSTNHPQNVIDRITIHDECSEINEGLPADIRERLQMREHARHVPWMRDAVVRMRPLKVMRIFPAAGPTMRCIAEDVQDVSDSTVP
jgi:hypothetical protein